MNPIDEDTNTSNDPGEHQDHLHSVCPVCSQVLEEIRGKLQCPRCHTICETCCEGGRG